MVTARRWNVLDRLDSEERIAGYLQAAIMDIEEGECAPVFILDALADAAKARAINQIAKETGIDRKLLCDMEVVGAQAVVPKISRDAIANVAKAFTQS
jgi:probable addiction module antidote protein